MLLHKDSEIPGFEATVYRVPTSRDDHRKENLHKIFIIETLPNKIKNRLHSLHYFMVLDKHSIWIIIKI